MRLFLGASYTKIQLGFQKLHCGTGPMTFGLRVLLLIMPCSVFDIFRAGSSKCAHTLTDQAKVLMYHSPFLYLKFYSHFLFLNLGSICFLSSSGAHYSVLSSRHPNIIHVPTESPLHNPVHKPSIKMSLCACVYESKG